MVYAENDDEFPDIMRTKLGNLLPQSKLIVKFEYLMPLEVCVNNFWKVTIEPAIHERYRLGDQAGKAYQYL